MNPQFILGLDIRLLNLAVAEELKKTRLSELWFAWDNLKDEKAVMQGIVLLKHVGIKSFRFYVLVGFDTTFEEDLYKFNKLKKIAVDEELNIRPYCMRHEKVEGKKEYIIMAQWVNMPWVFCSMSYKESIKFMADRYKYKTSAI